MKRIDVLKVLLYCDRFIAYFRWLETVTEFSIRGYRVGNYEEYCSTGYGAL
jgi:hypothetical protein